MRATYLPLAARIPSFMAQGVIRRGLSTILKCEWDDSSLLNTSLVPSSDIPSTTMTSKPPEGSSWVIIERKQFSMCRRSFRQSTTMETRGELSLDATEIGGLFKRRAFAE